MRHVTLFTAQRPRSNRTGSCSGAYVASTTMPCHRAGRQSIGALLQVGYKIAKREKHLKKPERGHCDKAGVPWLRHLVEFKVKKPELLEGMEVGQELDLEAVFQTDSFVDIAGTSIGKGFQGSIKRWGHKRGLMTHGAFLGVSHVGYAELCQKKWAPSSHSMNSSSMMHPRMSTLSTFTHVIRDSHHCTQAL